MPTKCVRRAAATCAPQSGRKACYMASIFISVPASVRRRAAEADEKRGREEKARKADELRTKRKQDDARRKVRAPLNPILEP